LGGSLYQKIFGHFPGLYTVSVRDVDIARQNLALFDL